MGQFVGNQFTSRISPGIKTSRFEDKLVTNGVGQGIHGSRRMRRFIIGVNPYATEIMSETRLEERAGGSIERLAGGAQHLMHDRRSVAATLWGDIRGFALQSSRILFPAFFTLAPGSRPAARTFTPQQPGRAWC
jgi:hypothetical protein